MRGSQLLGTSRRTLFPLLLFLWGLVASPLSASSVDDFLAEGLRLFRQGDLAAASIQFRKVVELRPDVTKAWYSLARIAHAQRRWFDAFYHLREVLALSSGTDRPKEMFLELVGAKGPLLQELKARIQARRLDGRTLNVLGFVAVHRGRVTEGIARLKQAVQVDGRLATAWDDLAWAYLKLDRVDHALRYSKKAFELEPTRPSVARHYEALYLWSRSPARKPAPFYPEQGSGLSSSSSEPPTPEGIVKPVATKEPVSPSSGTSPREPALDLTRLSQEDERLVQDMLAAIPLATPDPVSPGVPTPAPVATEDPTPVAGEDPEPPPQAPKRLADDPEACRRLYDQGMGEMEARKWDQAALSFQRLQRGASGYRDVSARLEKARGLRKLADDYARGASFVEQGRFQEAIALLKEIDTKDLKLAADADGVDDLLGEAHFMLGLRRPADLERFDKACAHYLRWLAIRPEDHRRRYELARCYAAMGLYAKAIEEIGVVETRGPEVLKDFPDHRKFAFKVWFHNHMIWILVITALWLLLLVGYAALKVHKTATGHRYKTSVEKIAEHLKTEAWDECIEECEEILAMDLGEVEGFRVRFSLARAFIGKGKLGDGANVCRALMEQYPDDATCRHLYTRVLIARGDMGDEALEFYRELLQVEPNNEALLVLLNDCLQARAENTEERETLLERLLELNPLHGDYTVQLAELYAAQGREDEGAERIYEQLLRGDPSNAIIREALAACQLRAGRFLEAIRESKEALSVDVERALAHDVLLSAYARLEMFAEAGKEYARLGKAHPESDLVRSMAERARDLASEAPEFEIDDGEEGLDVAFQRGSALYREGKLREALGPLQRAMEKEELLLHSGALLVRAHLRLEEPETALSVFERLAVTRRNPDDFLLELCYEVGRVLEDREAYSKALEIYSYICKNNVGFRDAFQRLEDVQERLDM